MPLSSQPTDAADLWVPRAASRQRGYMCENRWVDRAFRPTFRNVHAPQDPRSPAVRGQPYGLPSTPELQLQDRERSVETPATTGLSEIRAGGVRRGWRVNQNAVAFPRRRSKLPERNGFKVLGQRSGGRVLHVQR